jgi:hypothetical protein
MFVVVAKAQLTRARKALAKLENLPIRGVTYGGDDRVDPVIPGPGWTIDAVETGDDDGTTACFDLPAYLQKWCGQTVTVLGQTITLPSLGQLVDPTALPTSLKAIRDARLNPTGP